PRGLAPRPWRGDPDPRGGSGRGRKARAGRRVHGACPGPRLAARLARLRARRPGRLYLRRRSSAVILEDGRVVATAEIGQLGTVLRVAAPGIAGQARAGQFVHVRAGPSFDPLLRRPYSFNRIDRSGGEIELIVKALGAGGEWIASRREGDRLDLLGPLGSAFVIQRATKNLLLVAGGTGIAPMRVLAEHESTRRNVTLVMGGRSIQYLWPSRLLPPTVEYVTTTDDGSFGIKGRVTDALRPLLAWADQLCACGPWPMLAALGRMRDEAARASAV